MKKTYESLEMQITAFDTEDIIATSNPSENPFDKPVETITGQDGGEFL